MRPVATLVGAHPQVLERGRCRRRWWRSRGPSSSGHPSSGQGVGVADPQHAEGLLVVLVVDEPERAGVVARGHRPAPVEGRAEHGDDAHDDGHRGQPRRDLPPAEPVAGQVDLEGDHAHGGRQRQAGGGGHEEHVDGWERRRRAVPRCATQARPKDAMATVQPRTAQVWRSAARDQQRQRGRHQEAPPERCAAERSGLEPEQRGQVGRSPGRPTRR